MPTKRTKALERREAKDAYLKRKRKEGHRVATIMGIGQLMSMLPSKIRNDILERRKPKPIAVADPNVPPDIIADMFLVFHSLLLDPREELPKAFQDKPPELLKVFELSPNELLGIGSALHHGLAIYPLASTQKKEFEIFSKMLRISADFLTKGGNMLLSQMIHQAFTIVSSKSAYDERIYYFELEVKRALVEDAPVAIRFKSVRPEIINVKLNSGKRPANRVGWAEGRTIEWLSVDAEMFGGTAGEKYPVYVQNHALARLNERLSIFSYTTNYWLFDSMREPKIAQRQHDGVFLIEYTLHEFKLGYLVAKVVDKKVIITTFLFLTMKGTPEARQLYKKLRLTTDDIRYHGLNDIKTFVETDLFDEPVMAQLLKDCGCGHLSSLRQELGSGSSTPYAEIMKKYLRLDMKKQNAILERAEAEMSQSITRRHDSQPLSEISP